MKYPFQPKSTAYLEPGQFWAIPLDDGKYACGIVLARLKYQGKVDARLFLAGLLDWFGKDEPLPENLEKSKILKRGAAHIKTILMTGGEIIGKTENPFVSSGTIEMTDDIVRMGYQVLKVVAEGKNRNS